MRIKKKMIQSVALLSVFAVSLIGCGAKKEAVITSDGEDITESQKQYETFAKSSAQKFSYKDLTVNQVAYMMTEQEVKNKLGEPVSTYSNTEKNNANNIILEKVYSYNDLTLIFSQIKGEYRLTAAASVSDQDNFARGMKVGDSVDKIYQQYYREQDALNREVYSEDKSAKLGKLLYGDFTIDSLENVKAKNNIEYGMIQYNGNDSYETATSYMVEFTYFEPPYKGEYATIDDDFAQLSFDVDNKGKITAIRWYYYPEQ